MVMQTLVFCWMFGVPFLFPISFSLFVYFKLNRLATSSLERNFYLIIFVVSIVMTVFTVVLFFQALLQTLGLFDVADRFRHAIGQPVFYSTDTFRERIIFLFFLFGFPIGAGILTISNSKILHRFLGVISLVGVLIQVLVISLARMMSGAY